MKSVLLKSVLMIGVAVQTTSCLTTASGDGKGDWLFYAWQPDGLQSLPASDIDAQIESANKRISEKPNDAAAYLNLAQLYLIKKDLDNAEKFCREGLRYDLKSVLAKKILAQIFYHKHQLPMAKIILATLSEEEANDSRVLNLKGLMALEEGNNDAAVALLKQATQLNPKDVAAMMNLGILYFQYRQVEAGAAQFESILSQQPNDLAAKFHLATCYSVLGKADAAAKLYKEVLSQEKQHAQTHYNLAFAHQKLLAPSAALDDLKAYLATDKGKKADQEEVIAFMNDLYSEISKEAEETEQLKPKLSAEADAKPKEVPAARKPVSGEINKLESELEL
jgi:tetratricopeptide (TPR) repeat protein